MIEISSDPDVERIDSGDYPDYTVIKRWVFVALIFVAVTVVWIIYFLIRLYGSTHDARLMGSILYGEQPIANVSVMIGDTETFTDDSGQFVLANLSLGRKKVALNKDQFLPQEKSVFMWRKDTSLKSIQLKRDPQYQGVLLGILLNNFDRRPISGAQIVVGGITKTTNDQGAFLFDDIGVGEATLAISAIGFHDKEESVYVDQMPASGKQDIDKKEILLSPYGRIAFTSTRKGKKSIYSVGYDGTGLADLTSKYNGDSWGAQFVPDGSGLVFYSTVDGEVNQWGQKIANLYYVDGRGDKLTRITPSGIIPEGDFAISNDGRRVVFLAKTHESNAPEVYLAGLGLNQEWRQITYNDVFEADVDISPDGRKIAYTAFKDGSRDVFLVDTDTYKEKQITSSIDYEALPTFSPDGRNLLYIKEGFDFSTKMFVYSILTDREKEIYGTSLSVGDIMWSNDSEKILFTSIRDDKNNLLVIDSDGGNETKLTDEVIQYNRLIWPSNQTIVAFVAHTGSGNSLSVMDLTSRRIVEVEAVSDDYISWADR